MWNNLFNKNKDRFIQDDSLSLKRVQGAFLRRFKRDQHQYCIGCFSLDDTNMEFCAN
jgi:hypothetical protein